MTVITLQTWDHPRGLASATRLAELTADLLDDVEVQICTHSLSDFGARPIDEVAGDVDLIVLDHPQIGTAVANGALHAPWDALVTPEQLAGLEQVTDEIVWGSYRSRGQQWALPVDGAAHLAAVSGRLSVEPPAWSDLPAFCRSFRVLWPLSTSDAACSFVSLVDACGGGLSATGDFVPPHVGARALDVLLRTWQEIDRACLDMNPLDVLDEIAAGRADYSPLLFPYVGYEHTGAVCFVDAPARLTGDPARTILGGAGVAVAAGSNQPQLAARLGAAMASEWFQWSVAGLVHGQPAARSVWGPVGGGASTAMARSLARAVVRPQVTGYVAFHEWLGDQIRLFLGNRTRQSAHVLVSQINDAWLQIRSADDRAH